MPSLLSGPGGLVSIPWEVPGAGQEGSRRAFALGTHQGLLTSFLPSDGEHSLLR